MPWEVRSNKGKYCVYKKGGTSPISGGCYADRAKAVARVKALYANYKPNANVKESTKYSESVILDVRRAFAELDVSDDKVVWLEALPAKTWHTMMYGEVAISEEKLNNLSKNFKQGIRGQEVATDYEHGLDPAKGTKASGWIRDSDVRNGSLWVGVEFTEPAKQELKNKEWKYFSLEWEDFYKKPEDGQVHEDVIVGGALTNRPVAKGMVPINFSEVFIESAASEGVEGKTLSEVLDEVADLEHSEPGTGQPPQPREQEGEDSAIKTGSRRDPLPVPLETEDSVMTDEQLKKLKELFGIEDDVEADKLIERAEEIANERTQFSERVGKLEKELKETKDKLPEDEQRVLKFAEQYPDEHNRMILLEQVNRENGAVAFSEGIKRFQKKDGEELKPTEFGLSGLALQTITEAHKKFSEGVGTVADFEGAVRSVVNDGIVNYGEGGSSVEPGIAAVDTSSTPAGVASNRKAFSEAVNKKREEFASANDGKVMPLPDAIREVTKEQPDLAAAYRQSASA